MAKGRPSDNPLIVTVSSRKMVEEYVEILPERAVKLMDAFWPGPLTMILKIKKGALSKAVTGGLETAAFRMPQNKATLKLIESAVFPSSDLPPILPESPVRRPHSMFIMIWKDELPEFWMTDRLRLESNQQSSI